MPALKELQRMVGFSRDFGGSERKPGDVESNEDAATVAVQHIVGIVLELGGTPDQAQAVREAVRWGLLDQFEKAADTLRLAGFDEDWSDSILADLRATKAAAAA